MTQEFGHSLGGEQESWMAGYAEKAQFDAAMEALMLEPAGERTRRLLEEYAIEKFRAAISLSQEAMRDTLIIELPQVTELEADEAADTESAEEAPRQPDEPSATEAPEPEKRPRRTRKSATQKTSRAPSSKSVESMEELEAQPLKTWHIAGEREVGVFNADGELYFTLNGEKIDVGLKTTPDNALLLWQLLDKAGQVLTRTDLMIPEYRKEATDSARNQSYVIGMKKIVDAMQGGVRRIEENTRRHHYIADTDETVGTYILPDPSPKA